MENNKKKEFLDYLEDNIFSNAEQYGKEHNDINLVKGVRITRLRMSQQPTLEKMLHYFWSAMEGTDKSINFSNKLKEYGLTRFEDVFEDVRVKFNDNWITNS